jgi:uncharacterized RDD family membrane protein YckC
MSTAFQNLPDPQRQPEFYADVLMKRVLAWVFDALLITGLTFLTVIGTAFTAIFVLGLVTLLISLLYRWMSISAWSATPGMRLMSLELRDHRGAKLSSGTAFWHSALYLFFRGMVIPQIISFAMMIWSERGQSLHDAFTGVVALNRASKGRLARA